MPGRAPRGLASWPTCGFVAHSDGTSYGKGEGNWTEWDAERLELVREHLDAAAAELAESAFEPLSSERCARLLWGEHGFWVPRFIDQDDPPRAYGQFAHVRLDVLERHRGPSPGRLPLRRGLARRVPWIYPQERRPQVEKVKKTEEEWKRELTPEQYEIVREKGTEAPFTSELNDNKSEGTYKCVACGQPLFSSENKFDSGHRLAELRRADGRRGRRDRGRQQPAHAAHRGAVLTLRRPPGPRLRRRPGRDHGPALLHQRLRAEFDEE